MAPLPRSPTGAAPLLPPPSGQKAGHPHGGRGASSQALEAAGSRIKLHFLFSTAKWRNPLYPEGTTTRVRGQLSQDTALLPVPGSPAPSLGKAATPGQLRHRNAPHFCSTGGVWGGVRGGGETPQVKSKASPRGPRGSELPTRPALKATRGTKPPLPRLHVEPGKSQQPRTVKPGTQRTRGGLSEPGQTDRESAGSISAADPIMPQTQLPLLLPTQPRRLKPQKARGPAARAGL